MQRWRRWRVGGLDDWLEGLTDLLVEAERRTLIGFKMLQPGEVRRKGVSVVCWCYLSDKKRRPRFRPLPSFYPHPDMNEQASSTAHTRGGHIASKLQI